MKQVAEGVWQLNGFPPHAINVYLVGEVLIDAGTRQAGRRILRQLKGRDVTAHAITHAHPDHQGSSKEVCETLGIPFWVGEDDVDAAERPELIAERQPDHPVAQFFARTLSGPGRRVDRSLREGDEVAGFTVLDTPGHSAGHVAFWRESDRVLIAGDVLGSQHFLTGIRGMHEPPPYLSADPERNREAARRLAALEPALTLFGHGPPLRDTKKLVDFVSRLPR
ncbi:MAG TPA: MBL fold metallo-hydrolase [Thermoleophilaceae bacterium]|nr:MBL fold metallo-hydrolase [Thermoleophilaceae bacterium]